MQWINTPCVQDTSIVMRNNIYALLNHRHTSCKKKKLTVKCRCTLKKKKTIKYTWLLDVNIQDGGIELNSIPNQDDIEIRLQFQL